MAEQGDVTYCYGQIPWGKAIRSELGYELMPAGWVLPGGERTQDRERAQRAAATIHDEFVRAGTRPGRFVNPRNPRFAISSTGDHRHD